MGTAHTATPWTAGGATVYALTDESRPLMNPAIVTCLPGFSGNAGSDFDTSFANAEFIVRACNSHGSLVRELDILLDYADKLHRLNEQEEGNEVDYVTFPAARAALTAASAA